MSRLTVWTINRIRNAFRRLPPELRAQAQFLIGQSESSQGRTGKATEAFRRALVLEPGNVGSRIALANMLSARGDHSAAVTELETVIRAQPNNVQARAMKGQIEAVQGRIGASIATFEACIELDPDCANAHESLAHLYRVEHRASEAVELLRSWTARHPSDERAWRDLGHSRWEESEQRRNSSVFKDAEDGCPPFEEVMATDTDLAAVGSDLEPSAAIERLARAAEMWSLQVAAQRSVLGRLDTLMTLARYQNSQGRMRVMALNLVKSGLSAFPRPALPPPPGIPQDLRDAFTMQGRADHAPGYCDSTLPVECSDVLADEHLLGFMHHNLTALPESMQERARALLLGYEASDDAQTKRAFERFAAPGAYDFRNFEPLAYFGITEPLEGLRVAVVGEQAPFVASLCVAGGAQVDVVHVGPMHCSASLVRAVELGEWLASDANYDLIVCPSIVESWGLGRHGEPLDPDGDLTLFGRLRAKLAPNGRLAASLPLGRDRLIFNATRIYGPHRLPKLLAGLDRIGPARIREDQLGARRAVRTHFVFREPPRPQA
jgi:cytochrome c-type biogenesis protein CcmH/NrfG